jgi:hypothetical protein
VAISTVIDGVMMEEMRDVELCLNFGTCYSVVLFCALESGLPLENIVHTIHSNILVYVWVTI